MSLYLLISTTLWKTYGENLPESPTKMASVLLTSLEEQGYHLKRLEDTEIEFYTAKSPPALD
jgi:hypothetical protein